MPGTGNTSSSDMTISRCARWPVSCHNASTIYVSSVVHHYVLKPLQYLKTVYPSHSQGRLCSKHYFTFTNNSTGTFPPVSLLVDSVPSIFHPSLLLLLFPICLVGKRYNTSSQNARYAECQFQVPIPEGFDQDLGCVHNPIF